MIKVVSVENMRISDAYTIKNEISGKELMYKAGKAIYDKINWYGNIVICSGYGNNAGDGYVLANLLHKNGFNVKIYILDEKFTTDSKYYYDECINNNISVTLVDDDCNFDEFDIIVDAIFGTGFRGSIPKKIANLIDKINSSKKYVISIDINSGLNGNSGICEKCIESDITISIGDYKAGHFLNMAKDVIKEHTNVDIGIKLQDNPFYLLEDIDIKDIFKERNNYTNKSTYGYISIIGGSVNYTGSIKLATIANASMRSGAGVVTIAIPEDIKDIVMPYVLESTIMPLPSENGCIKFDKVVLDKLILKNKTICIGMGMQNNIHTQNIIKYLLEHYQGNLIIDADGLNALQFIDEKIIQTSKCKKVFTPHMGEFSRISHMTISEINENPIKYLKEYAENTKSICLLKGPTTIVTDGDKVYLVDKGCAGMATAGSGDVLAGILSACVSYENSDLLLKVASGVYLNGVAGMLAQEEYTDISMLASDTVMKIPEAIKIFRKKIKN